MKNTKPFWKVIYILLIVGLVITIIGALMGGIKGTRVDINDYNIGVIDRVINYIVDDNENINLDFNNNYEINEGDIEKTYKNEKFDSLNLTVGGARIEVVESENDELIISSKNADRVQYYVNGETVFIKTLFKDNFMNNFDENVLTVELPNDKSYDNFNITLGAGRMEIEEVVAKSMNFKIGAGSCEVLRGHTENLNLELGMGEFDYNGRVENDAKINCAMGSVKIKLDEEQDDYSYDLECALGNITYGDFSISGIGSERKGGSGESIIDVECGMGDVLIDFNGSQDNNNEEIKL
ncbi:MAG TPA: DUF4097 family beta strand repeat-containing protein [Anaerovoracaceae bacterium]|nr:DUF4097 family beta strand repeat-containing protein [Anaerovoracaceae bacterium]